MKTLDIASITRDRWYDTGVCNDLFDEGLGNELINFQGGMRLATSPIYSLRRTLISSVQFGVMAKMIVERGGFA